MSFDGVAEKLSIPGAVGIIPTDTVYGLVARAADRQAVARLYDLKKRDHKPGTVIAANLDQLVELGIKRRYLTAVQQFWPGATSVIIPCSEPNLDYLHLSEMSLAIRLPADPAIHQLLTQTGPLATSSANHPGQPPANTIPEAKQYFGDQVDFYIDGGNLAKRQPSTIIRIVDDAIEIIRKGAVKLDEAGRIIA